MRIALFEAADSDVRASSAAWPGDRVETSALLMPSSRASVSPPAIDEAFLAKPASEPFVCASALWAALLAVLVLTAGGGLVSSMVGLALFM